MLLYNSTPLHFRRNEYFFTPLHVFAAIVTLILHKPIQYDALYIKGPAHPHSGTVPVAD